MLPELQVPAHDGSGVNDHVPEIERLGNQLAARTQEVERQKQLLAELLKHVGRKSVCYRPKCKQPVLFVWHIDASGFRPYNPDGTSHLETCIDREQPRGRRKKNAAYSK